MNSRGAVPVIVIYVLGALAATQLVPNWRLGNLFAKGPQTKELAQAQADLEKAKADAATAKKAYDDSLTAERSKMTEQVRSAQQFAHPIPGLLATAPQTPEVKLAAGFAQRVNAGLALAIGDLPADRQLAINQIVQEALSDKQAEVDRAKAQIAVLDAQLATVTKERATLAEQIPVLQSAKDAAELKVIAKDSVVAMKTAEVVKYAEKAAAKEDEAGSAWTLLKKLAWVVALIVFGIAFANFILPCLAQEFPLVGWLVGLNKTVKSLTSAHL